MITCESAGKLGRRAANGGKPVIPTRREKRAHAVAVLVKRAAAGAIGGAFKKLLPYLIGGGVGAGASVLGGYFAGKQKAKQPTGFQPYSGSQPLWGKFDKRMLGRMGINPQKMQAQQSAMRDIGAGGAWRKQQHDERMQLIRGMFTS